MLTTCFNPSCKKEFHYLRYGRVVRVSRAAARGDLVEHCWLCGDCCMTHNFRFDKNGNTILIERLPHRRAETRFQQRIERVA